MFLNKEKLLFFFLCVLVVGCTHLNEKINDLPYHTSKTNALDILGPPLQIKRIRGLDYWIYKFKLNGNAYIKPVIFKEGYFLKSGKKKPYPNPEDLLEESENFDEYRKAIKFIKKNRRDRK